MLSKPDNKLIMQHQFAHNQAGLDGIWNRKIFAVVNNITPEIKCNGFVIRTYDHLRVEGYDRISGFNPERDCRASDFSSPSTKIASLHLGSSVSVMKCRDS